MTHIKGTAIQEALSTTEALVHALTSVPEPICVINAERKVQLSNSSACRLFGLVEGGHLSQEIAACLSNSDESSQLPSIEIMHFNSPKHHSVGETTFRVEQIPIFLEHVDVELLEFIAVDANLVAAIAQLEESQLTSKEIEVALFIRSGLASKAIARQLFISVNTVKSHLKKIHSKLGTRSRAELVARLNMQTVLE